MLKMSVSLCLYCFIILSKIENVNITQKIDLGKMKDKAGKLFDIFEEPQFIWENQMEEMNQKTQQEKQKQMEVNQNQMKEQQKQKKQEERNFQAERLDLSRDWLEFKKNELKFKKNELKFKKKIFSKAPNATIQQHIRLGEAYFGIGGGNEPRRAEQPEAQMVEQTYEQDQSRINEKSTTKRGPYNTKNGWEKDQIGQFALINGIEKAIIQYPNVKKVYIERYMKRCRNYQAYKARKQGRNAKKANTGTGRKTRRIKKRTGRQTHNKKQARKPQYNSAASK